MPVWEYALDSSGVNRVQIHSGSEGSISVLHNRSLISTISNREELAAGKEITLKDGTIVKVKSTNGEVQVLKDNLPLTTISVEAIAKAKAEEKARVRWQELSEIAAKEAAYQVSKRTETNRPPAQILLRRSTGSIIAIIGSLLAIFAFFSMPFVSGLISHTEAQVSGQYGIFILDIFIAIGILIFAGCQFLQLITTGESLDWAIMGIIIVSILALIFVFLRSIFVQFVFAGYSSGLWVFVLAMVATLVGGIMQARES